MNTSFVPIAGATVYDDDLQVPYPKEEQRLFDHYGFAYDDRNYGTYPRIDTDFKVRSMERSDVAEAVPSGTPRLRRYVVTETRR